MIGASGKLVQLAVEEDSKTERDYVITRCHNLKVTTAQLMDHSDTRLKNAMKTHVQVRIFLFKIEALI